MTPKVPARLARIPGVKPEEGQSVGPVGTDERLASSGMAKPPVRRAPIPWLPLVLLLISILVFWVLPQRSADEPIEVTTDPTSAQTSQP